MSDLIKMALELLKCRKLTCENQSQADLEIGKELIFPSRSVTLGTSPTFPTSMTLFTPYFIIVRFAYRD